MKKALFTILVGVIGFALLAAIGYQIFIWHIVTGGDYLSKKEIFALVEENHSLLLEAALNEQSEKAESIKEIKNAFCENGIAFFDCGGYGMGADTGYYGFYYTPEDTPKPLFNGYPICDESELKPEENGYTYREAEGDNLYYTERITDGFYYYEMHF